jgi:hypothetical protein
LIVPNLNVPQGTNIAFADGIPALAIVLKLLRRWLPDGFHGIGLWYVIAWILQPVAAIWALRGTGERRLIPQIVIAVMATSVPAWWARFGHAALTGHFIILVGLGLYLRLTQSQPRPWTWGVAAFALAFALLVHPYVAVMVLGLLCAVPLTLWLRRDQGWIGAVLGLLLPLIVLSVVVSGLGYLGAHGGGGYGAFPLNIASPFWPARSALFPGLPEVDGGAGRGWEGYNYLGFGLLLGLGILLAFRPRAVLGLMRRHAGLALALLGFTLLAISTKVDFGFHTLLDLGEPRYLGAFRSSGRFFWPVTYALMLGVIVLLSRTQPRGLAACLLVLIAVLQFADLSALRRGLASASPHAYRVPDAGADALRPQLERSTSLTLLPSWFCVPRPEAVETTHKQLLDIIAVAAAHPVPVNTMYLARWYQTPGCNDEALASAPLRSGELRVFLPIAQGRLLPLFAGRERYCHAVEDLEACYDPGAESQSPASPSEK